MRKLVMSVIIGLGLAVGFANGMSVNANESNVNINAEVEYQIDGDVIVEYSDGSCVLYNDEEEEYIMWIPETEDYEHCYSDYDELMYAIEYYHNMHNRVVTDTVCINDEHKSALNPLGYFGVAEELEKIEEISGAEFIDLIDRSGLEIYYNDDIIEKEEEQAGFGIAGFYNVPNNIIVMRQDYESIDKALIHEVGHCIDNQLGLRYNDTIIDSYMNNEVSFTDESNSGYYYSSIAEYIAESISEYYNGTLDEDTVMYQELDSILGK